MTVLSTGVGFIGKIMEGQATAKAANYQAQVARNNQIIADQNARYSVQAGEAAAQAQDFKNRNLVGAITAAQGASGISLDSPTLTSVREAEEQIGRLDTATIMSKALMQSQAYSADASNFAAEASLQRSKARNATTSGLLGGMTSLIGGASSFSDKWSRFKTVGVPGYA